MANPFVAMSNTQAANSNESLPLFVEYGYDFEKQCFRYDEKGQNLMVTENEALKVWIYKALLTERYRYLAYDDSYGITIEPYQGRAPNSRYTAEQISQNIREGLLINPYIARINHIDVEKREDDDLIITVDVTSIYSEESLTVTAGRSEA